MSCHPALPGYHAGITETLMRAMRQIGISTSISSRGTLREHLVHPKDKIEKLDVNGVVYFHQCAGANNNPCDDTYVGESVRSATARNAEHMSTAQSAPGVYKSAIMQHAADATHHFRTKDVKILSRESGWHERGIRESIFIRGLSPSLNRNDGRHILPHCYDTIINKFTKKPPPPETHQSSEPLLSTAKRAPGRPRVATATRQQETTLAKTLPAPTHNSQQINPTNPGSGANLIILDQSSSSHSLFLLFFITLLTPYCISVFLVTLPDEEFWNKLENSRLSSLPFSMLYDKSNKSNMSLLQRSNLHHKIFSKPVF